MRKILAFGEVYSANVGDGVIFECLQYGMAERGINISPADLSLRTSYSSAGWNERSPEVGAIRGFQGISSGGAWRFDASFTWPNGYRASAGSSYEVIEMQSTLQMASSSAVDRFSSIGNSSFL